MPLYTQRKKRLSCSSVAIIGGNDYLLTEILVLLPEKSLVRFKSVSKNWLSLISGESFTRFHVQNHSRRRVETQHSFIMGDVHGTPQFFVCHPTVKKLVHVTVPMGIKHHCGYVKILQSINGLLLLSLDQIDYVVFNPTTKRYRFIYLDGYGPLTICLIFDPSKSEYYKVVMGTRDVPLLHSVYDSATDEWRHGIEGYPFEDEDAFGFSVSDGTYHNVIVSSLRQGDSSYAAPNLIRIPKERAYDNYIFDSNEYLNVLQLKRRRTEENKWRLRVGEWIDDEWIICKRVTLDFDCSTVEVLGMIREGRIDDAMFLIHVPGRLLIYKFSDRDWKVLVDYRSDNFYVEDQLQFEHAHPFIRTLAPV